MVRDDQPDAREGRAGRRGDAEAFVVPVMPGNARGGKGPQLKTNTTRSEGPGDWATYQLRKCSEPDFGLRLMVCASSAAPSSTSSTNIPRTA